MLHSGEPTLHTSARYFALIKSTVEFSAIILQGMKCTTAIVEPVAYAAT